MTKSVKEIDTDAKVDVDLAKQQVRVESKAALEEMPDAVVDADYPVTNSAMS